ncbi:MAG: HlyC/CorC family transporter [Candidatus Delongbacteria bacterium]|nr:HlyC/CorC family transporter [Candidatus Delongbacteria bacterium]
MLMILVVTAFLFSAFFSMSEIIYTVSDRIKIRVWSKSGGKSAKKVKRLIKNPDNYLIPILIGNNIANVAYATFFTYLVAEMNWRISHYETTLYLTLFLVMFAEIIPKIIAQTYADKLSVRIIYPFMFVRSVLSPIAFFVKLLSRQIMKFMKMPSDENSWVTITKGDIALMVDEAAKRKTVKRKDAVIIKKLLNMGHKKVKEIMLHRKSIVGVDINNSLYRLKKIAVLTSFSKIVVYENDLDDIKGVIFVRDLLNGAKEIREIIRPVVFVRETASVLSLFKTFKKEKASIGVAIDEFGGCVGLVTMHDILEMIVGRVDDPHDSIPSDRGIIHRPERNILIVDGSADPEELNRMINSIRSEEKKLFGTDYETINGYIINTLKRIPMQGETINLAGHEIKIVKARKNYIETAIIKLKRQNRETI